MKRLAVTALLAGGLYGGIAHLELAPAVLDADARQSSAAEQAEPAPPRPLELAEIEVTRVAAETMVERLRVSGELRPVNRAALKARVSGTP